MLLTWIVLVALGYAAGGAFGRLLSVPPGYSSAFWVPAGLGLMAVLSGPRHVWLGVLLGSTLHNAIVSASAGVPWLHGLAVSAGIGTGASLQALVGAQLVRRSVGYPTALTRVGETLRFVLLGGPVACLVSATTGVGLLALSGVIPPGARAFSWFNWWVGDTIGVLLIVPLWLVVVGEPRELWRRRGLTVALPLLGLIVLALVAFAVAQRQEAARIRSEVTARLAQVTRRIEAALDEDVVILDALRGHFEATPITDREAFAALTRDVVARHGHLRAVEWVPRVADRDRLAFERSLSAALRRPVTITEQSASGALVPSAPRPGYVPVEYVEPLAGNEAAVGYDLASDPARREALERSAASGSPSFTRPIHLVTQGPGELGVLAFLPVGRFVDGRVAPAGDRDARGFVLGVIDVGGLMDAVLAALDVAELDVRLSDVAEPQHPLLMFDRSATATAASRERAARAADLAAPVTRATIPALGRLWLLEGRPTLAFLDHVRSPLPWIVQAAGMLFSALCGVLLLTLSGRTDEVRQEVALRTRELSDSNRALMREVAERERIAAALRRSEQRYRTVIDRGPLMIAIARHGRFLYANARYLEAHRISSVDELIGQPIVERVAPRDRAVFVERARQRERGTPVEHTYEVCGLRADGSEFPAVAYVDVIELDDGPAVIGFFEDATERKRLEAEVAAESARLQLYLRRASDGVAILDQDGRVVEVSDSFCALLGYTRAEMLDMRPSVWDARMDDAEIAGLVAAAFAGEVHRFETVHRRKDRSTVEVEVTVDTFTADGRPYLYCSTRDITELRRLQRALLDVTAREQSKLGHDLHDELGQVLTGISMLAASLAASERTAGRPAADRLAELSSLARQAIGTCRAIAHGLSPLHYAAGGLATALREMVRQQQQGFGATIELNETGRAPIRLGAEALDHLYRIVQEAVTNARRHAKAQHITVTLDVQPEAVRVVIEDDGVGFERAGDATGMGLRIMEFRAAMIGALLTIEPRPAGGARVTCTCPQLRNPAH